MRTGIAQLPLHEGKAPRWLFERMVRLAREITRFVVVEFGPEEMLQRLSEPYWFQAFGCVLGFDWHSSGLTTTVCGALKEGLRGLEQELGLFVCGGKGATSRKTPMELAQWGMRLAVDPSQLIYASRMSAKVDNTALQDGYQLYHHTFVFTKTGSWAVVQQGMSEATRYARRYHWLSEAVESFVCEPHSAICCNVRGIALNMVAKESETARQVSTQLARQSPHETLKELKILRELRLPAHHPTTCLAGQRPAHYCGRNSQMVCQGQTINRWWDHHVANETFQWTRLAQSLAKASETYPHDFEQLLSIEGVGPKTIRALSLLSELVYGAQPSYADPVRYSFAHGGKDGHPYPVDRSTYEQSIQLLHQAIEQAKIGRIERMAAFRRLSSWLD